MLPSESNKVEMVGYDRASWRYSAESIAWPNRNDILCLVDTIRLLSRETEVTPDAAFEGDFLKIAGRIDTGFRCLNDDDVAAMNLQRGTCALRFRCNRGIKLRA